MTDGEDEDGAGTEAGKLAALLRSADALGDMAEEDRAEGLARLLAQLAEAVLSAAGDEMVLKRVKAATGASMKVLRADYRLLGRGRVAKMTHHSVADAFAEAHEGAAVFCHSRSRWLIYNRTAGAWRLDPGGVIAEQVRRFALAQLADTPAANEDGEVVRIGSMAFGAGIETMARADMRLRRVASDFDKAPHLLGTPGGVYDLTTGGLFAGTAGDAMITRTTAVAPAEGPGGYKRFLAFLGEACGGDQEFTEHVVRVLGYALLGANPEQVLIFLFGPGGNGKSVLLELMRWLFGGYAVAPTLECFTAAAADRHTTDLAMLAGARLSVATETRKGKAWDEQRINAVTGGDLMTARFMRRDNFSFQPQFLPLFAGNHRPVLTTVNEAARRRFLIWPFTARPAAKDIALLDKLKAEGPAILRLLISECARWHADRQRGEANSLRIPAAVTEATHAYLGDQEPVVRWAADRCEVDAKARAEPAEMFDDYRAWMTAQGDAADTPALNNREFKKALENLGYGRKKHDGRDFWSGIRLRGGK